MDISSIPGWVALLISLGNAGWNICKYFKDRQERMFDRDVVNPLLKFGDDLSDLHDDVASLARFSLPETKQRIALARELNSEKYPKFIVSLSQRLTIIEKTYPFTRKQGSWLELEDLLTDSLESIWNAFQKKSATPEEISKNVSKFQNQRIKFEANARKMFKSWPKFPK